MWPEISAAKKDNKREFGLSGQDLTNQLEKSDGKLDSSLFELTQLNFLRLKDSPLLCEVPASIQMLENLQELMLPGNSLTSLPGELT